VKDHLVSPHAEHQNQMAAPRRRLLVWPAIDVALRVRLKLDSDAALTMRTLGKSRRILLASPALANTLGDTSDIAALAALPTLSSSDAPGLRDMVARRAGGRNPQYHA
jgi:hypothetical protein